jgi:hypothetical protein
MNPFSIITRSYRIISVCKYNTPRHWWKIMLFDIVLTSAAVTLTCIILSKIK